MVGRSSGDLKIPMSSARSTQSLEMSLPAFSVRQSDDGIWLLAVQLAPADQARLDAARPSPRDLCCQAQHALAQAQYGSRIYPERTAVDVYISDTPGVLDGPSVLLDGPAALWFVSHAQPADVRAFLQTAKRLIITRLPCETHHAA